MVKRFARNLESQLHLKLARRSYTARKGTAGCRLLSMWLFEGFGFIFRRIAHVAPENAECCSVQHCRLLTKKGFIVVQAEFPLPGRSHHVF